MKSRIRFLALNTSVRGHLKQFVRVRWTELIVQLVGSLYRESEVPGSILAGAAKASKLYESEEVPGWCFKNSGRYHHLPLVKGFIVPIEQAHKGLQLHIPNRE
jgi:hypothetical protein